MESIMIAGNTRAFGRSEVIKTAEMYHLTMISFGDKKDKEKLFLENVSYHHMGGNLDEMSALFSAQNFTAVWYLSSSLDEGEYDPMEGRRITEILRECRRAGVGKLIFLDSCDAGRAGAALSYSREVSALGIRQTEEMALRAAGDEVRVVCLRLPYLSDSSPDTWLNRCFEKLRTGQEVAMPWSAESRLDIISSDDLLPLLWHITDETGDSSGVYTVTSGFACTYGELAEKMKALARDAKISFSEEICAAGDSEDSAALRRKYGFVPVKDEVSRLPRRYEQYMEKVRAKLLVRGKGESAGRRFLRKIFPFVELVILFGLTELLCRVTSQSVYFQSVDVRLAFIFIMGCSFGLKLGIPAAAAECVMLARQYALSGVSGLMLFYNVGYWVPFVVYLAMGTAAGYLADLNTEKLRARDLEITQIRDKYLFLKYAFEESLANQASYRSQIWSFRDSYGKIGAFLQSLDQLAAGEICRRGVGVLEDGLAVKAAAIYRVDWDGSGAARMAMSEACDERCTERMDGDSLREYLEACEETAVWSNRNFDRERPFCVGAAADYAGRKYLLLLWDVETEKMNTWYINQFKTLCEIIGLFLRRAERDS